MGWIALGIALGGVGLLFVFVRFTIVEEGTAKAVMVFGEFSKIIFRWRSHWIDTEWSIWRESKPGEEPEEGSEGKEKNSTWSQKIFGGLVVYFWPFQKIHRYKHRWTDIRLQQARMEVEFHEEDLNHVLLKPAVYAFKLTTVETKPPERIPVDVLVLVTLRVRNPYLFLFVAPPTPVEDILARISAETRALVTGCQIDELLRLKGESFWKRLKRAKVIEDTLRKWGVKLAEKGIEIREIDLPSEYQKVAAAKKAEELRAAARSEEIMGTVISAVTRADGREESAVQAEFRADPQAFYQKHQSTIDNTMTKLSMEERAYVKIETPGATGFGGELLRLIGAWKRMPMGPPEEKPTEEKKEEKGEKAEEGKAAARPKILNREDLEKMREELNGLSKEERRKAVRALLDARTEGKVVIDWKKR